jgi:hypothetical protein
VRVQGAGLAAVGLRPQLATLLGEEGREAGLRQKRRRGLGGEGNEGKRERR